MSCGGQHLSEQELSDLSFAVTKHAIITNGHPVILKSISVGREHCVLQGISQSTSLAKLILYTFTKVTFFKITSSPAVITAAGVEVKERSFCLSAASHFSNNRGKENFPRQHTVPSPPLARSVIPPLRHSTAEQR